MASFTKEELKTQLLNNGIDLPPSNSKKEAFVALYEKHVAPKEEFSADEDDEEIIISSKAKAPIAASNGDDGEGEVDVESLDDSQLLEMLKENNIDAGPIVNSTRNLYKKKLIKVLGASVEETEVSINKTNGDENFSDTEPEDVADNTADSIAEEPLDDTEPDSVLLSSEDEQPSGLSKPVTRKSPRISSSLNKSGSVFDSNGSLLRNRFSTVDTPDSSHRFTPTGRKSIHEYEVTETTKTEITKFMNGVETKNTTHTIEKKESIGDDEVSGEKSSSFWSTVLQYLSTIVLLMIVLGLGSVLVLGLLGHLQKPEAIDQMQETIQKAANKVSETLGDALGGAGEAAPAAGDVPVETGEAPKVDVPVVPEDSRPKTMHV